MAYGPRLWEMLFPEDNPRLDPFDKDPEGVGWGGGGGPIPDFGPFRGNSTVPLSQHRAVLDTTGRGGGERLQPVGNANTTNLIDLWRFLRGDRNVRPFWPEQPAGHQWFN